MKKLPRIIRIAKSGYWFWWYWLSISEVQINFRDTSYWFCGYQLLISAIQVIDIGNTVIYFGIIRICMLMSVIVIDFNDTGCQNWEYWLYQFRGYWLLISVILGVKIVNNGFGNNVHWVWSAWGSWGSYINFRDTGCCFQW